MPEFPEVETIKNDLAPHLVGWGKPLGRRTALGWAGGKYKRFID